MPSDKTPCFPSMSACSIAVVTDRATSASRSSRADTTKSAMSIGFLPLLVCSTPGSAVRLHSLAMACAMVGPVATTPRTSARR